ncbi:MAG: hypothetical protein SVN78_09580 [Deferribacterota bacterium]|nr:hypothetical protein [Deferribacterota bacterium]
MKKITKYFYGKYLKYWYAVAVVIATIMFASYYFNRHLDSYNIIIFNNSGTIEKTEEIEPKIIEKIRYDSYFLTTRVPFTKAFIPNKKIDIEF